MAASGVSLLMLLPIIWKRWSSPSKELMRKMLIFGLPFVPGGLGYALAERLNIFFLANLSPERVRALYGDVLNVDRLASKSVAAAEEATRNGLSPAKIAEAAQGVWGDAVVGAFGTGWKLGIFLVLVVQMFRFAWQPFFLQHAEDPDAKPLFARIFTLLTAGLVLTVLAISFLADDLVRIPIPGGDERFLIGKAYWFSISIVPLALVAYFFQGWYYLFSAGLYLTEKTKYLIHATFAGSAASIVLNIALTPRLGMVGAAWSTVGAYAVMTAVLYAITQRFYPMAYDWKRVWTVCALGLGLFLLWAYVPALNVWYVEVGLVLLFGAALVPIGIIPPRLVKRLLMRA
jgi:O-antigen/teichoic acid export membrane protein